MKVVLVEGLDMEEVYCRGENVDLGWEEIFVVYRVVYKSKNNINLNLVY